MNSIARSRYLLYSGYEGLWLCSIDALNRVIEFAPYRCFECGRIYDAKTFNAIALPVVIIFCRTG